MFQPDSYISSLIVLLKEAFQDRLLYVGLQGSYLRGEARETSDIDLMVVIDGLTPSDLDAYRGIIGSLPHPELSCGFLCGKADLACWNPLEINVFCMFQSVSLNSRKSNRDTSLRMFSVYPQEKPAR